MREKRIGGRGSDWSEESNYAIPIPEMVNVDSKDYNFEHEIGI